MRNLSKMIGFGVVASLGAAAPGYAAVNLIGQSVNASFSSLADNGSSTVQFVSPKVVGAGTEFTGSFVDVFGQAWGLSVDVYNTGFILKIGESTRNGDGNISSSPALSVALSNLSGIGPISLLSYSCAGSSFGCGTFGGGPSITNLNSGTNSASVDFSVLRDGETYNFTFDNAGAVPEPATWAMMILGFGMTGLALRRRGVRSMAVRYS